MAGSIPVKLVVIIEESQLPVGLVCQCIDIDALGQQFVFLSDIDANTVIQVFNMAWLRLTISSNAHEIKADIAVTILVITVLGRKVAIDATLQFLPFRADRYSFLNSQYAAGTYLNIAIKRQDSLIGSRARDRGSDPLRTQRQVTASTSAGPSETDFGYRAFSSEFDLKKFRYTKPK